MSIGNFWDSNVWSLVLLISVIGGAVLVAGILKSLIKPLRNSLIPSSVLGGVLLLIISSIVFSATGGAENGGKYLFELDCFSFYDSNGSITMSGLTILEILTYHCLGLGFVAMALRQNKRKVKTNRALEVFDSGVTTVGGYLLQAVLGLVITIVAYNVGVEIWNGAGLLLPFGYGQGTGQALNYGSMYGNGEYAGFESVAVGRSFGLAVAAMGFLSACIGGVIYMNVRRKKGKLHRSVDINVENVALDDLYSPDEIPMSGSVDKMTVQIAIVLGIYGFSYVLMELICNAFSLGESLRATIFGFNFMLGTFVAIAVKAVANLMYRKKMYKKKFLNTFILNRVGGFFFDIMIVAGIAAIRIDSIRNYWGLLLILGVTGAVATYFYVWFICRKVFPDYADEQFLAWYGMLTGTASTGIILLREIDCNFTTPAADNLVYQNLPAIVLGFPIMLLATYVYTGGANAVYVVCGVCAVLFAVMMIILFRNKIFKRKKNTEKQVDVGDVQP